MKDRTKTFFNIYSLIFVFLYLMPFVDSLSGAFHDKYPIGQVYRFLFFIVTLCLLLCVSSRVFGLIVSSFCIFVMLQIIVSFSGGYVIKSIQDTIKLFTPIVLISLLQISIKKKKIHCDSIFVLLDFWSLVYPLLIIIPYALGLGVNAYDNSVGAKGFFYAINEISFILSSLVLYRFYVLANRLTISAVFIMGMDVLCLLMMGTKTGYATVVVGSLVLFWNILKERNCRKIYKNIVFISVSLILILFLSKRLLLLFSSIFDRWSYQRYLSNSTLDFLFSMRLRRLSEAFRSFFDDFYFLFGWGLGGELAGKINVEMDFIDLLLRTGALGFCFVFILYFFYVKKVFGRSLWGTIIVMWSFALSFGAGHVLFYGQSGMMLAINIVYSIVIAEQNQILKNKKKHVYDGSNKCICCDL